MNHSGDSTFEVNPYRPWPEQYVYKNAEHHAGIRVESDWGGPDDWQAVCACGWVGSIFSNVSRVPNEMRVGRPEDALKELLIHVGYDPDADLREISEVAKANLARIAELVAETDQMFAVQGRLAAVLKSEQV